MNLIGYFRGLMEASRVLGLSANARSLYVAVLGEFNAAGYVERLKLSNVYLQEVSGIRSSHSFECAREVLQAGGLIEYEAGTYRLKEWKGNGKRAESERKGPSILRSKSTTLKEKEKEEDARAREQAAAAVNEVPSKEISTEVAEVWRRCEGKEPDYAQAVGLRRLEVKHGVAALTEAIIKAKQDDRWGYLTPGFVRLKLETSRKAAVSAVSTVSGWEDAALAGVLEGGVYEEGKSREDEAFM